MKQYLLNHAIAFDQWLNVWLGGDPDETLSSRAHRMRTKRQKYWYWLANTIDAIFFWQSGHCESSYHSELIRNQSASIRKMLDSSKT